MKDTSTVPPEERSYYELAIERVPDGFIPFFLVRETHHYWDKEKREFLSSNTFEQRVELLLTAENVYLRLQWALAERGYKYSDMDPLF